MNKIDRTRSLMMETVFSALFFLVCAALLFRLLGAAYEKSVLTGAKSEALDACRTAIDTLFAADDKAAAAAELGFDANGVLTTERYTLSFEGGSKDNAGGGLYEGSLICTVKGAECFRLPVTLFEEARP
ncbi:MAG: hypothetical protein Q4C53_03050 [Clostridia bacterium]|nr:hypothetical protein [Clostridia bacterium]